LPEKWTTENNKKTNWDEVLKKIPLFPNRGVKNASGNLIDAASKLSVQNLVLK